MVSRTALFKLIAVAGAVAIAAAGAEVGLRLTGSGRAGWVTTAHREPYSQRARLEPNHRSRQARPVTGGKGFRVLVVGDSFTWGDGVRAEDSYPYRMKRALEAARTTPRVRVGVWSRPGWNTDLERRSLAAGVDPADVDLLVLGYCLNDAEPSDRQQRVRDAAPTARREPASRVSRALYGRSRLYRLLFDKLENLRVRRTLRAYYRGLYDKPGWEVTRGALAELRRTFGKRTLLVIFPIFDSQLDDRYPYRDLHARVAAAGREAGFEVLDLLPTFEGMDARRLAVEPFSDPHPDELAHRIAAERIVEELGERGLVPAPRKPLRRRAAAQ